MQNNNIPIGFISLEEAIKLIESDTRSNAKVDTSFLLNNLPYLRVDGNYTIKKLKHEGGKVVPDGKTQVQIRSEYERAMLEHAIVEHYKLVTGYDINPESIGLRSMTTAVDDEKNPGGRVTKNEKPLTRAGDDLGSGNRTVAE